MMQTQQEIDTMTDALRAQGLTWGQTNFAVALVRNAAAAERERCAKLCEGDAFVEQWKGLAEAARRIRGA